MSGVQQELLAAVRAAPEDLQPRLILADFLTERGDPRGAFINAQCRLSERGLSPASRRRLNDTAKKLFDDNRQRWAASALAMGAEFEFRLGFMHKLVGELEPVLEHWPALVTSEPVIHLELTDMTADSCAQLADSGILPAIRYLTLRGEFGDSGVRALSDGDLQTIERLNLKDAEMTDEGLRALASARGFQPRRLTLTGNPITDTGAQILVDSELPSRLECLFLSRTQLTDTGVATLAASPKLGLVRDLALGSLEELSDTGTDALIESPYLTSLRYVEVNTCWEVSRSATSRLRARFTRVRAD